MVYFMVLTISYLNRGLSANCAGLRQLDNPIDQLR